jgi:methylmalonyl-CoA mutase
MISIHFLKQWKQKIQFELKGADYNETVVWNSPRDIQVKPFIIKMSWPNLFLLLQKQLSSVFVKIYLF